MPDGGEGIGGSHPQIVVTMYRNNGLINIGHTVKEVGDDVAEFFRQCVADSVRNIDGCCAGINGVFDHSAKIVYRGTSCVFTGEFNIIGVVSGLFYASGSHCHNVITALFQLVLDVNV